MIATNLNLESLSGPPLSPGHHVFVLREDAHLLDRLVAEDDGEAVYGGAGHPGCQPLPEHTPLLCPPEMSDRVRYTPPVNLKNGIKTRFNDDRQSRLLTYLNSSSD